MVNKKKRGDKKWKRGVMRKHSEATGLCRSEGAEIPVLFRDLISSLCFVIEEGGFSQYF